jgi:competence ComEA-like helix-hairpin-helix protein
MKAALGATLTRTLLSERKKFGRFESMEALLERVPGLAKVDAAKLEPLFFGTGKVSINLATKEELDAAGFTPKQAAQVVAWREKNGDFESLDELQKLGLTQARIEAVRELMTAADVEAFFNSRPYGAAAGGTGYGPDGGRQTPVMGADGSVAPAAASVVVGATDLFNRARPPAAISLAMYGLSVGAPEFKALEGAARRGVPVRIVLNDDFNEGAVAEIKKLKDQGLPVEVRVQKAKTMHEKFGVVGDDVFSGSANFSTSSSTKHSEDRFTLKNNAEVAAKFQATFDALWEKSKVV